MVKSEQHHELVRVSTYSCLRKQVRLHPVAEDEDSEEEDAIQIEARRSSHSGASTSGALPDITTGKAAATTRLRTRAFAASCLNLLPNLVASDARHIDPLVAQVRRGARLPSLSL